MSDPYALNGRPLFVEHGPAVSPVHPSKTDDLAHPAFRDLPRGRGSDRHARQDARDQADRESLIAFAQVQDEIAEMMRALRAPSEKQSVSVEGANAAITALLPMPTVTVPLPPTDRDMIEHAARVAKGLIEDAMMAQAAQAHAKSSVTAQILT